MDARNSASAKERIRHGIFACHRAGMRLSKFGSLRRAPKLVRDHGFSGFGRSDGKAPYIARIAQGFEKQQKSIDLRIFQRRHADLAERNIGLDADRNEAGKTNTPGRAARG